MITVVAAASRGASTRDALGPTAPRGGVDMADGNRQGVRRVQRDPGVLTGEKGEHHRPNLGLLRVPVPDERLLDQPGFVLEDGHRKPGGRGQEDPAGVRELDGRGDVLSREDGLDRYRFRPVLGDQDRQAFLDVIEPLREGGSGRGAPDAAAF